MTRPEKEPTPIVEVECDHGSTERSVATAIRRELLDPSLPSVNVR